MKRPALLFAILLSAASATAQPALIELRGVGEVRTTPVITAESARQLARLAAHRDAERLAVARLRALPGVQAIGLPAGQLATFVTALLDVEDVESASVSGTPTVRAAALVRVDAGRVVDQLVRLRRDRDATGAMMLLRAEADALEQRITSLTQEASRARPDARAQLVAQRAGALIDLSAKALRLQVIAALARTEENPAGGRLPSAEGRQRARQRAEEALALAPDSPDARYSLGDVLVDARQPDAAEVEYRRALLVDPASSAGHVRLAEALRLAGRFSAAVRELRLAVRLDRRYGPAHSDLGLILRATGNVPEAVAEYREAIRLDPDDTEAHNGLAVAFAGRGRFEEAEAEFREIIRVDPESAIGYFNLATVLADLDRDAESAAALREVVRINPNHYNAHYNLGELFRLEGKFDDSTRQFREYMRLAPDTPQTRRNRQRAQSLIQSFENP